MQLVTSISPAPQRMPLPQTCFGKEWTERLYARFQGLKNKAGKKKYPFKWANFLEFLEDLSEVVPEDYHPEHYRFQFDLEMLGSDGKPLGYCRETLSVKLPEPPKTSKAAHDRKLLQEYASKEEQLRFVANVTRLMLTGFEGSLDDLVEQAKQQ